MFLTRYDIETVIREQELKISLEEFCDPEQDNYNFLKRRVDFAIDFIKSKIKHRYDPAQIFLDVLEFSTATTFNENNLIIYTEPDFSATVEYSQNTRVNYKGFIYNYINATPSTGNLPTDATYWTRIIRDNQIYTYTNETASSGNYPENTTYWTQQDTRSPLIVTYTTYITVYELYKKLQPNKVPEWLVVSRQEVVDHLNRIARGTDEADLPIYADTERGQEISWGFVEQGIEDFSF